jgi:hypothetical protein
MVLINDLGGDMTGKDGNPGYAEAAAAEMRAAGGTAAANGRSVADPAAARAIVKHAMDLWGRVDILVGGQTHKAARAPLLLKGLVPAYCPSACHLPIGSRQLGPQVVLSPGMADAPKVIRQD